MIEYKRDLVIDSNLLNQIRINQKDLIMERILNKKVFKFNISLKWVSILTSIVLIILVVISNIGKVPVVTDDTFIDIYNELVIYQEHFNEIVNTEIGENTELFNSVLSKLSYPSELEPEFIYDYDTLYQLYLDSRIDYDSYALYEELEEANIFFNEAMELLDNYEDAPLDTWVVANMNLNITKFLITKTDDDYIILNTLIIENGDVYASKFKIKLIDDKLDITHIVYYDDPVTELENTEFRYFNFVEDNYSERIGAYNGDYYIDRFSNTGDFYQIHISNRGLEQGTYIGYYNLDERIFRGYSFDEGNLTNENYSIYLDNYSYVFVGYSYLNNEVRVNYNLMETTGWDYAYYDIFEENNGIYKDNTKIEFNGNLDMYIGDDVVDIDYSERYDIAEFNDDLLRLHQYGLDLVDARITTDFVNNLKYDDISELNEVSGYENIDIFSETLHTDLYNILEDQLQSYFEEDDNTNVSCDVDPNQDKCNEVVSCEDDPSQEKCLVITSKSNSIYTLPSNNIYYDLFGSNTIYTDIFEINNYNYFLQINSYNTGIIYNELSSDELAILFKTNFDEGVVCDEFNEYCMLYNFEKIWFMSDNGLIDTLEYEDLYISKIVYLNDLFYVQVSHPAFIGGPGGYNYIEIYDKSLNKVNTYDVYHNYIFEDLDDEIFVLNKNPDDNIYTFYTIDDSSKTDYYSINGELVYTYFTDNSIVHRVVDSINPRLVITNYNHEIINEISGEFISPYTDVFYKQDGDLVFVYNDLGILINTIDLNTLATGAIVSIVTKDNYIVQTGSLMNLYNYNDILLDQVNVVGEIEDYYNTEYFDFNYYQLSDNTYLIIYEDSLYNASDIIGVVDGKLYYEGLNNQIYYIDDTGSHLVINSYFNTYLNQGDVSDNYIYKLGLVEEDIFFLYRIDTSDFNDTYYMTVFNIDGELITQGDVFVDSGVLEYINNKFIFISEIAFILTEDDEVVRVKTFNDFK